MSRTEFVALVEPRVVVNTAKNILKFALMCQHRMDFTISIFVLAIIGTNLGQLGRAFKRIVGHA